MAMTNLPPIPIPHQMLVLLEDYPDLIDEIRHRLAQYLKKPDGLQPLDHALWLLEDTFSTFISRARDEVSRAEASGNAEAITKAKAKLSVMFRAGSPNGGLRDTGVIVDYFKEHEEAF